MHEPEEAYFSRDNYVYTGDVTMQRWHVAVDGDDQWSGLLAAPNAAMSDGPFATPTRARDALRQWRRAGGSGPVEVTIGGGTYRLTESFVLGPEDSGTPDAPVVWRAAEGQEVRLSGGVTLTATDHLVEFNEIDRVCLDTSDTGAFYIGRNMSERGVMVRHNYFHHIGSGLHNGESAIYFDDGALGSAVGNVFFKAGTVGHARMGAIFIHMGKDVLIENNLFIDCELAIGTLPCGRQQWVAHIHGQMPGMDYVRKWLFEDVDIAAPPYATQYPELKDIEEYPDRNTIRRNVAYQCKDFLSINRCRQGNESFQPEMSANLLTYIDPGLVDMEKEDFRLRPDSRVFRIIAGFEPIPVERIGPRTAEKRDAEPGI